ncbi:hypothetical protein [uncultured Algibacter sp.]|uniref:hypothetical protein n=1 Tax=uncultured Algibacter sp. TaxID=298659 RepID=UPI002635F3A9|nr:hypothetical protein [uncultured Algibacter sp.]
MTIHLQIIGYLLIALAIIHIAFPKYFSWKTDLELMSLINKQLFIVHTFFIALTVALMGLLCVISFKELTTTHLGKTLCLGLAIFWGIRLIFQLFVYSPKLWKGKRFETFAHIFFTLLWIYITVIFLYIYYK